MPEKWVLLGRNSHKNTAYRKYTFWKYIINALTLNTVLREMLNGTQTRTTIKLTKSTIENKLLKAKIHTITKRERARDIIERNNVLQNFHISLFWFKTQY